MLIANCADIHARGTDLEACRSQLAAMVAECVKRWVNLVTIAGDIFDRSSIGDSHASTGAIAAVVIGAVAELTKHGIEVLMIPGNHDASGAGSADALHVFDGMKMVQVIRRPEWWCPKGNVNILCLPWSWLGRDPADAIGQGFPAGVAGSSPSLLLAHLRVTGAKMSSEFTCEPKPGDWQVSRGFLESLPFDHFALGDFHGRQDLTEGRGGYVGALRQLTFGEEGNPAGFEVWDTETNATEWVELDAAPRYRTLEIGSGQMPPEKPEGNEHLKIRYTCAGIMGGNEAVRRLEAAGIEVEHLVDREERTQRAEVPEGIVHKPHDLIRLFASTQNPPPSEERVARMLRLYDEVHEDKTEGMKT